MSVHRRSIVKSLAALPLASRAGAQQFQSRWRAGVTQPWIGPEYWSNPLQDWRLHQGRIECVAAGGDRNVYLLTREVSARQGGVQIEVVLGRLDSAGASAEGWGGVRAGIRGYFNDYRDSAVRGLGLNAGVTADGRLFIGEPREDAPAVEPGDEIRLRFRAEPSGSGYTATLSAVSGGRSTEIRREIPAVWLTGGLALVSSAGPIGRSPLPIAAPKEGNGGVKPGTQRGGALGYWFRDWTVGGAKVTAHPERAWGPILFAQYTVSRGVLKLTAQLAPVEDFGKPAGLEIRSGGAWRGLARAAVDAESCTAAFRVEKWNASADTGFRIVFQDTAYTGTIQRDPAPNGKLTVGALTCQNDYGFPHTPIARNLEAARVELLLFTGDQLYERSGEYGVQREPPAAARLDYLRKWFLFGWAWGELTRKVPAVCLPDDHDVYHGNVWGAGGRRAEGMGPAGQDSGGFTMPAAWVNLVQRTQSSHLPDPPDAAPAEQGIRVHYSHLAWGGVSFALLEDRKWKSAPRHVLPEARISNGWPQNPAFTAEQADVRDAQLLGERQERFLDQWAADWAGGIRMKAAVSATIFCNLATLPQTATSDSVVPKLAVPEAGVLVSGDKAVMDHDSNGWPQSARNRALASLRKCLAIHIAGDQHLPSTVQYGIERWNDAAWALCTPAVSNIFPRRWFPPSPGGNRKPGDPPYLGEHRDGFGNRITVHAVANPRRTGVEPESLHDRVPGFGIVEFDLKGRRITLTNWPRWADLTKPGARPYDGWPLTIRPEDNGLSRAAWVLEEAESGGRAGLVAQVRDESTGETAWWGWIEGDRVPAPVWSEGVYSVRFFDPDGGYEKIVRGLRAKPREEKERS